MDCVKISPNTSNLERRILVGDLIEGWEAIKKEKVDTIRGTYEYDERGVNKGEWGFICQVQNKKRLIVWPKDLATSKPEFLR